jgi:predicted GIY-YIG superfamily endonuclease
VATFDDKFGVEFLAHVPTSPGVYRFHDNDGAVLYVGKAKNLRRRLANYRNATRKRVHRKMRILVREASALKYETCESEQAALLREGELIRELSPHYNVDGAFAFLYPSVGVGKWERSTLLCFTTHPSEFAHLELQWYGCFRSRPRAKLAFHALVDTLLLVAHREKRGQLPEHPRIKGSVLVGFRQLPTELYAAFHPFFSGDQGTLPKLLAVALLSKPRALRDAAQVQTHLKCLAHFFEADTSRLRAARETVGLTGYHVAQDERDALFIRARTRLRELCADGS